jgi:hypothetical protein
MLFLLLPGAAMVGPPDTKKPRTMARLRDELRIQKSPARGLGFDELMNN